MDAALNFISTLDANSVLLALIGFLIIQYLSSFATKADIHRIDLDISKLNNSMSNLEGKISSIESMLNRLLEK